MSDGDNEGYDDDNDGDDDHDTKDVCGDDNDDYDCGGTHPPTTPPTQQFFTQTRCAKHLNALALLR